MKQMKVIVVGLGSRESTILALQDLYAWEEAVNSFRTIYLNANSVGGKYFRQRHSAKKLPLIIFNADSEMINGRTIMQGWDKSEAINILSKYGIKVDFNKF